MIWRAILNKKFSIHIMSQLNKQKFVSKRYLSSFNIKGIHEPQYLDYLKPQIPFYKFINIQIKGYDYAVLESYGSYLHSLSNKLGLTVNKYWCTPCTTIKVETLENESSVVDSVYELNIYERNVQIQDISCRLTSILVDIVSRTLPTGIQLSIHEHDEKLHETPRYIPDLELIQLKKDLAILRASRSYDDEEEADKKKKK